MKFPTTWLEPCDRAREDEIMINTQAKRPPFPTRTKSHMDLAHINSNTQPLRIQNLYLDAMVKR